MSNRNKMVNKAKIILTSGCSFTQYRWPTWANYLKAWSSKIQPYRVVNVGQAGVDNSIITYRMIDYLNNKIPLGSIENKHNPNDVSKVCVMWTGHERYCPQYKDIVTHKDIKYVGEHFHPTERLRNLAMCIDVINLLCQTKNIKCYNFFYFDLTGQERKYLTQMTTGPWRLNYTAFSAFRSNNQPVLEGDYHPTPLDQWIFARDVVAPTIGLGKWNKESVPTFVEEHERFVRAEHFPALLTDYSHADVPEYLTEHMDPFETKFFNIKKPNTAVTNTKNALDDSRGNNWFDYLKTRLYKL